MALDQSALLEVLEALKLADVDDRIRAATETLNQALIEAELTATIGASPHERTDAPTAQRNGHRRTLTTAGDLDLRIGEAAGQLVLPRRWSAAGGSIALFAVVMEAYLRGASTRKVDDLVKALGADTGISKSEVSRICADLDKEVAAFADRSLAERAFPCVFLDATYTKARVNQRVVCQAVVAATGVTADGHREVLRFAAGDTEDGASGPHSSARSRPAGSPAPSWSSPSPTPSSRPPLPAARRRSPCLPFGHGWRLRGLGTREGWSRRRPRGGVSSCGRTASTGAVVAGRAAPAVFTPRAGESQAAATTRQSGTARPAPPGACRLEMPRLARTYFRRPLTNRKGADSA